MTEFTFASAKDPLRAASKNRDWWVRSDFGRCQVIAASLGPTVTVADSGSSSLDAA